MALGAAALLALLISGPLGLPTAPSAAYRAPAHRAARKVCLATHILDTARVASQRAPGGSMTFLWAVKCTGNF